MHTALAFSAGFLFRFELNVIFGSTNMSERSVDVEAVRLATKLVDFAV